MTIEKDVPTIRLVFSDSSEPRKREKRPADEAGETTKTLEITKPEPKPRIHAAGPPVLVLRAQLKQLQDTQSRFKFLLKELEDL